MMSVDAAKILRLRKSLAAMKSDISEEEPSFVRYSLQSRGLASGIVGKLLLLRSTKFQSRFVCLDYLSWPVKRTTLQMRERFGRNACDCPFLTMCCYP